MLVDIPQGVEDEADIVVPQPPVIRQRRPPIDRPLMASAADQVRRRIVPPVTKKLRIWLTPILITFGLAIVGFIVSAYMINGEEICLDRRPWWGPAGERL